MAIAPINYTSQVVNPLDRLMQGIGQVQQVQMNDQAMDLRARDQQMREQAMAFKAAQYDPEAMQNMSADMAAVLGNPEATGEDIAGLLAKYPALQDEILKPWNAVTEERKASGLRFMGQMYSMLDSGNIDLALETVDQRIAAAERSGNKRAGQEAKMIRNLIQTDPVKAKNLAQMMGSVTGGADWWAMTGGKGPFEGTGMEAQSRNILLTGDPNSPEYAAAYQYVSQPKVDMKTGTTITPDMSAFTPPGGVPGSGGAPGGGPTVSMTRTPQQIEADKASAGLSLRQIADLRSNPAVAKNLGWAGLIPNEPGGAAADAKAQMLQMQGKAFLQAFEMLKGGGQITEREGAAAAAAMSRMQAIVENGGSYEAYIKALDEFEEQVRIGARKLGVTFDGSPPPQGSAQQQAPSRRSYLDALD